MDLAKIVYSFMIMRDKSLPNCLVRNTNIPEELGRICYLMSDKTGTLTQNEMVFKKLHLGSVAFASDSMEEVVQGLRNHFTAGSTIGNLSDQLTRQIRRTTNERMADAVLALAICHNVTPMTETYSNPGSIDVPGGESKEAMAMVSNVRLNRIQNRSFLFYRSNRNTVLLMTDLFFSPRNLKSDPWNRLDKLHILIGLGRF